MCGIKDVFGEGTLMAFTSTTPKASKPMKETELHQVGFVSNLRFHDEVQRGGLGSKLCL